MRTTVSGYSKYYEYRHNRQGPAEHGMLPNIGYPRAGSVSWDGTGALVCTKAQQTMALAPRALKGTAAAPDRHSPSRETRECHPAAPTVHATLCT